MDDNNFQRKVYKGQMESVLCFVLVENYIFYGTIHGDIRQIDIDTKKCVDIIKLHSSYINHIEYSSGCLYTCSKDKDIKIYDIAERTKKTMRGHLGGVCHFSFSQDGMSLASCGDEGLCLIWDLDQLKISKSFSGHLAKVTQVSFYDKFLISCSWDGFVKIVNLETDEIDNIFHVLDNEPISCFEIYDRRMFIGVNTGEIYVYGLQEREILSIFKEHEAKVNTLCQLITRKEQILFSAGEDNCVFLWEIGKVPRKGRRKRKKKDSSKNRGKGSTRGKEDDKNKDDEEPPAPPPHLKLLRVLEGHEQPISKLLLVRNEEKNNNNKKEKEQRGEHMEEEGDDEIHIENKIPPIQLYSASFDKDSAIIEWNYGDVMKKIEFDKNEEIKKKLEEIEMMNAAANKRRRKKRTGKKKKKKGKK